jgi:hypothetical protein
MISLWPENEQLLMLYSEFLGANELDNRPFIVMPYLKNGNARDYVEGHPSCDRLQIVSPSFFDHS